MIKMRELLQKDLTVFLVIFLFGLAFLFQYGAHLDQDSEQAILYSNVLSYCERLKIFPSYASSLKSEGILPVEETVEIDHGMSVFYPIFWIRFVNERSSAAGNLVWHSYIWLISALGVFALYKTFDGMISRQAAVFASILLALSPRIFAQMHYNNKDTVLMALVCMIYACGRRLCETSELKYALLFGMLGALASNMKIIGLFIWGLVLIWIFFEKIIEKKLNRKALMNIIFSAVAAGVLFLLLTPATWVGLRSYFRYVIENAKNYRWDDYVLFHGSLWNKTKTGIPGRYLPYMLAMTTPVGILVALFLGALALGKQILCRQVDKKTRFILVMIACGMIPFCYAVINRTPVYNGWRHFYFVYPSVIAFTAYFLDRVKLRILPVLYIGFLILEIISGHPYQYAYYNEIARHFVSERYELDYWDMSFRQLLENLACYDQSGTIRIAAVDNPTKWGMEMQCSVLGEKDRERFEIVDDAADADYLVVSTTYTFMYRPDVYRAFRDGGICVSSISAYGNELCCAYRMR